jgi:hypothetical protein
VSADAFTLRCWRCEGERIIVGSLKGAMVYVCPCATGTPTIDACWCLQPLDAAGHCAKDQGREVVERHCGPPPPVTVVAKEPLGVS